MAQSANVMCGFAVPCRHVRLSHFSVVGELLMPWWGSSGQHLKAVELL